MGGVFKYKNWLWQVWKLEKKFFHILALFSPESLLKAGGFAHHENSADLQKRSSDGVLAFREVEGIVAAASIPRYITEGGWVIWSFQRGHRLPESQTILHIFIYVYVNPFCFSKIKKENQVFANVSQKLRTFWKLFTWNSS